MFRILTAQDRLQAAEAENAELRARLAQKDADIDYIAMMCAVELETAPREEVNIGEQV